MRLLIRLKVHADSKENRLVPLGPDRYEAWVKAPPREGRANAAALTLLAGALGVAAKRLRVAKGATSPAKIIEVLGA